MGGSAHTSGGTADHPPPERPARSSRRAVLIAAFPKPGVIPLDAPSTIVGRGWLAEQGLSDREVSSRHLELATRAGQFFVRALATRNGTWLDGAPLPPGEQAPLANGALLRLGRTVLVHRTGLAGALEPAAPLGQLVGPFGLRRAAGQLASFMIRPPSNVLIEGETGSGKELAAAALANALRGDRPFCAVNVAGVAAGVFESQLFGHVAGAFSDARKAAKGIMAAHDGGTVFLDEIGELPAALQPKLLRLLENREVLPVGAERATRIDVLIIAATNRDLDAQVERGTFRRDLLARLATARVSLPPLRERAEDLFAIICALAAQQGEPLAHDAVEVEAVERLMLERWPNNVRDLQALLGAVRSVDPKPGLRLWAIEEVLGPASSPPAVRLTRALVEATLQACAGSERQAARKLGISRGKLRRFVAKDGADEA